VSNRVAVIDTGTNSTRLLVADVDDGILRELDRRTEITRLGEGVEIGARLLPAARSRVEAAVEGYSKVIDSLGALSVMVFATSSVRDAADGPAFIEDLAGTRNYSWSVLSGEEEARYAFSGATLGENGEGKILLFDIGGGSTEIVTGSCGRAVYSRSLQTGCVRVKERFFSSDPPSAAQMKAARTHVGALLEGALTPDVLEDVTKSIAVAGTMTTLAALDLGLEMYDREAVHGHVLSAGRIDDLLEMLSGMTVSEREAIGIMERGRADVITAGALIASLLIEIAGIDSVAVSENDILDGVALAFSSGALP